MLNVCVYGLIASEDRTLLFCQQVIFGDISPAKRASIMRVAPVKAVVACSPKTSLVSQSGDSFSTERHCPDQIVSQPTPVSLTVDFDCISFCYPFMFIFVGGKLIQRCFNLSFCCMYTVKMVGNAIISNWLQVLKFVL